MRENLMSGERSSGEHAAEFSHYPDNSLPEQIRDFDDVPSLLEVVRSHFKGLSA